jgi:hypothetical protein
LFIWQIQIIEKPLGLHICRRRNKSFFLNSETKNDVASLSHKINVTKENLAGEFSIM